MNRTNAVLGIIIFLLIVFSGISLQSCNEHQQREEHLKELLVNVPKPVDMTELENENLDLQILNQELQDSIDYLESQNQEVRYVTKVQTKLIGGETVYKTLPANYQYKLNDNVIVGDFSIEEDQYKFKTYDLTFNTQQVEATDSTLVKVTVTSSYDNKEYVLPVEAKIYKAKDIIEEDKIFDPKFTLGLGISYPLTGPEAVVGIVFLEGPEENFSWIMPTVSISEVSKIGITPFMYNIGKPIPLMNDLWIGAGYETDFSNHYGTLNISSKL